MGFTLAGIVVGYLLMHPFAMLAYTLGPQNPHTPMDITIWGHQIHLSFSADMLAMGGAFAFMGGLPVSAWGPGTCRKSAGWRKRSSLKSGWLLWKPCGT